MYNHTRLPPVSLDSLMQLPTIDDIDTYPIYVSTIVVAEPIRVYVHNSTE